MLNLEPLIIKKFKNDFKRTRGTSGVELRVKCPFCDDTKYKMYINSGKGLYHCFKCEKKGHVEEFITIPAAFINKPKVPILEVKYTVSDPGEVVPLTRLPDDNHAIQYLQNRKRKWGIEELNDLYGLRYCTMGKSFASGFFTTTDTLIIPVHMNGKVVGWQSRLLYDPDALTPDECKARGFYMNPNSGEYIRPPKYFTSPGMKKGDILFNFDNARKHSLVVITEGAFDAMSVGRPAVACFGKGISDNQIRLIKSYWDAAIILLDPDVKDTESRRILNSLKRAIPTVDVKLEGYKDPGDAPREEIWKQISAAIAKSNMNISPDVVFATFKN